MPPLDSKHVIALSVALNFRNRLLVEAGVDPQNWAGDRRTCYELVTMLRTLDTRQPLHRDLQSACQVIDDCLAALQPDAVPAP